jgi:ferredoxin
VGTRRILEILERICNGQGRAGDIERLEHLCHQVSRLSLCGLGQGAPSPVISTLKHFRAEYEAHIYEKRCPAKVCRALIQYTIRTDGACTGCTVCARNCPVNAISGERRSRIGRTGAKRQPPRRKWRRRWPRRWTRTAMPPMR